MRGVTCLSIIVLLATTLVMYAEALAGYFPPPRLLAIGDIHGDIENLKELLRFAQIIDCDGRWSAGHDVVVQMGDVVDRGPHAHEIIEYLYYLRHEAQASGGEFIQLIGNHELLNFQGDRRFVHDAVLEVFGGLEGWKESFHPVDGEYGKRLAALDIVVIRNSTVFVHGGLAPHFAQIGAAALNSQFRHAVENGASIADPLLSVDGPVWNRKLIKNAQLGQCEDVYQTLRILTDQEVRHNSGESVTRMVIGHSIMPNGAITVLCNGTLIAIDIGISAYMQGGGHLGVLEIKHNFATTSNSPASPATVLPDLNDHYVVLHYPSQPWKEHVFARVQQPRWGSVVRNAERRILQRPRLWLLAFLCMLVLCLSPSGKRQFLRWRARRRTTKRDVEV